MIETSRVEFAAAGITMIVKKQTTTRITKVAKIKELVCGKEKALEITNKSQIEEVITFLNFGLIKAGDFVVRTEIFEKSL